MTPKLVEYVGLKYGTKCAEKVVEILENLPNLSHE